MAVGPGGPGSARRGEPPKQRLTLVSDSPELLALRRADARAEQARARGNLMQKEKKIKKAEKALETKVCLYVPVRTARYLGRKHSDRT